MNIYCRNFQKLVQLGVISGEGNLLFAYAKSVSDGFMDWNVEHIASEVHHTQTPGFVLSLTHYYEQNGDLCKDPDMTVAVYPSIKAVEALSFQMDIPPVYQEVYPEPGRYSPSLKQSLNDFLGQWLINLVDQNHGKEWTCQAA